MLQMKVGAVTFLMILIFIVNGTSLALANDSRWEYIGTTGHVTDYRSGFTREADTEAYLDKETVEYDAKSNSVYFWEREKVPRLSQYDELDYRFSYRQYILGESYLHTLRVVWVDYKGRVTETDQPKYVLSFVDPDDTLEKMVNRACKIAGKSSVYASKAPHRWQIIAAKNGWNYEICKDVFWYDKKTSIITVVERCTSQNRCFTKRYAFDLKNKKYSTIDLFTKKPEWHNIIPDTPEEYLFRAAKELVKIA